MGVRHHDLKIGEEVYVLPWAKFGVIVELMNDDETAAVDTTQSAEKNARLEYQADAPKVVFAEFDELYQVVPDAVDREGNEVCYEHKWGIDYPYYSPNLDENLFESEIEKK